jgi:glycosyltransferase involved in cell wall biosynthesis
MINQPIRILELRSVRGTGGGPEKTILLGAERADRRRFSVTVCYIRDGRDDTFGIGERAQRLGVDYVEVLERSSFDPRVWPALRRIVRERAIDIVHAHEYKTNLLALLLACSDGTIPLSTAHGWTGHSRRERLFYYALDKQLLRAFPLTIAVSSQIRSELIRHRVAPDRVQVVLNGIDHNVFRRDRGAESDARRDLGVSAGEVVIGSIGRLEPQKRFDLLIRACATLRDRWPGLRLLIAGDGSERGALQTLAASLLPPHAYRLLGHRADVVCLHHAFDLFVQSSDYEGTPNAVLEAMAFETPLVATAAGGTAEIVNDGEHGLIVPCGDVSGLAVAIERALMERDLTSKRVASARRRVETSLSFDQRVAAVERIYAGLAARFPRPAAGRRVSERCA